MERSQHSSFLKSLALAFGDGLLFGVAVKLAQGPSRSREKEMTDLGPLAERLRKVEDHTDHLTIVDRDGMTKFSEGLDGRVLEKVIVALEARLTEHVGQVDRRLAEIDAQVALDLKAVDTHTTAQSNAVERAIQQIETQVRDYVSAAQLSSSEQIAGVDQKLSALQEALPAKFREIIEAVRQSMEARVALELTELEDRVKAGVVAPERLGELESRLHGEVEALAGRLSGELHGLAEQQQSQTAPLQQALQQLETKLNTLREELPPKIRQIVEAVEASMDARISASGQETGVRISAMEQALAALRDELPHAGAFRQAIDEDLRRHAEQVGALDQKLTVLQEELPPKIKAIVDAVRESLDARMAIELKNVEEHHTAQIRETEARVGAAQQQNLASLQSGLAAVGERLDSGDRRVAERFAAVEQHTAQVTAGVTAELGALENRQRSEMLQLETRLAAEIHSLEARVADRSPDLDKALQYASLLEARVQSLELKLQHTAEDASGIAVERVWQMLEVRLQQRAPQPVAAAPAESITGLRQKSTSAEQNVLDLIAGIGQLFEKPAPPAHKVTHEPPPPPPPAPAATAAPEPAAATASTEDVPPPAPEPPSGPKTEPVDQAPEPAAAAEPAPEAEPQPTIEEPTSAPVANMAELAAKEDLQLGPIAVPDAMESSEAESCEAEGSEAESSEPSVGDKPPVILFRPKESGRKWRIPFVSSFLLMTAAIAWLQFM
jgi:hypothetical protein